MAYITSSFSFLQNVFSLQNPYFPSLNIFLESRFSVSQKCHFCTNHTVSWLQYPVTALFVVQKPRNAEQVLLMIFEGDSRRRLVATVADLNISNTDVTVSDTSGIDS